MQIPIALASLFIICIIFSYVTGIFLGGVESFANENSHYVVFILAFVIIILSIILAKKFEDKHIGFSFFISMFPATILIYGLIINSLLEFTVFDDPTIILIFSFVLIPVIFGAYFILEILVLLLGFVLPSLPFFFEKKLVYPERLSIVISVLCSCAFSYFIYSTNTFEYIFNSFKIFLS